MADVVTKCIDGNVIDNGGIIISAPAATNQLGSNYQINTYSSSSPATGIVIEKYDTRFTGLAPCVNVCTSDEVIGNGVACVLWV
jgi:hypothetical protein